MNDYPWIFCNFRNTPSTWECSRCGDVLRIPLPVGLIAGVSLMKSFFGLHKKCKRSE